MIVIVGAGLAGLAAAWRLSKENVTDFIVVEAQERAGGRVKSAWGQAAAGCRRLDLGAQWLHGQAENPIYECLCELGCIEGPEDEEVEFEGVFVTQHGVAVDRALTGRLLEVLLGAKAQLYRLASLATSDNNAPRPVDVFRQCLAREACECPTLRAADRALIDAIGRWFELYETIDNSCESLDLLSMRAYSEWTDFDGGQMVRLRGGWQAVVDKLVELVGAHKVRLGCPVQRIDYTDANCVRVRLAGGEVIRCDAVLVTVSLGVLKATHASLFEPRLANWRRDHIEHAGFGPANKIFLEFERPHLQAERGLKLLWLDEQPGHDEGQHTTGPARCPGRELPSWARFVTGFELVHGAPECLLAWVGGAGAAQMEAQSDEQVGNTCLKLLKQFQPAGTGPPPKLISVTRSSWSANPYTRGAYSYESAAAAAASENSAQAAWQPVGACEGGGGGASPARAVAIVDSHKMRLLFAGEATAGRMHATAHGAIVSGLREADRLIKARAALAR